MIYSFNTGVGLLKDTRIKVEHIGLFQTQMIKAGTVNLVKRGNELWSRGEKGARNSQEERLIGSSLHG